MRSDLFEGKLCSELKRNINTKAKVFDFFLYVIIFYPLYTQIKYKILCFRNIFVSEFHRLENNIDQQAESCLTHVNINGWKKFQPEIQYNDKFNNENIFTERKITLTHLCG